MKQYKLVVFKKGVDSNNLQYDDILGIHDNLSMVEINARVNSFIDNGWCQFAEYKIIEN